MHKGLPGALVTTDRLTVNVPEPWFSIAASTGSVLPVTVLVVSQRALVVDHTTGGPSMMYADDRRLIPGSGRYGLRLGCLETPRAPS